MSFDRFTTFDDPHLFTSAYPVRTKDSEPCNFITFLATAQRLRIPFLSITWEAHRSIIGAGATSRINQTLVNLKNAFAFKRIGDGDRRKAEAEIYECLISELMILGHPEIRNHPNIVELQGICWDIAPKSSAGATEATETVWPVLVFQKSQYGDMYNFAGLPVARELSINDRIKICRDIGNALAHLHLHGIIHGDIKPQNVLIFRSEDGSLSPKVADFGFSVLGAKDEDQITLHGTPLWRAPELDEYPTFSKSDAMKTDVFSFGLLCLWFILEEHLLQPFSFDGPTPLSIADNPSANGKLAVTQLANLKSAGALTNFVQRVLVKANTSIENKEILQDFFSACLSDDPGSRGADMIHAVDKLTGNRTPRVRPEYLANGTAPEDDDFGASFGGFGKTTEEQRLLSKQDKAAARLAILNFVVRQRQSGMHDNAGLFYTGMLDSGLISLEDMVDLYRRHGVFEEAEGITNMDIQRLGEVIGPDHIIVVSLKSILLTILESKGRWEEVGKLRSELMITVKKSLGHRHPVTITITQNLARDHFLQGQWREAAELWEDTYETSKLVLGKEHPQSLWNLSGLAEALQKLNRHAEATQIYLEIIDASKRTLGEEHIDTISFMGDLAAAYVAQGRFNEAEEGLLNLSLVAQRFFGHDDEHTLNAKGTLAGVYYMQGRYGEAEALAMETADISKGRLGIEHPNTLSHMHTIVVIHRGQRKWEAAKEIARETFRISSKIFGFQHKDTLTYANELAQNYQGLGRYEQAAKLGLEIVEASKKVFGPQNPSTLSSLQHLTTTYRCQGLDVDAEKLEKEIEGLQPLISIPKQAQHYREPPTAQSNDDFSADFSKFQISDPGTRNEDFSPDSVPDALDPAQDYMAINAAFFGAARKGDAAEVERLLSMGVGIEARTRAGGTALSIAAREGHVTVVEMLLANGADINAESITLYTPLDYAVWKDHAEVVELLLARGADMEAIHDHGGTTLHKAAAFGKLASIKLLLDAGANLEAQDEDGKTPLFWAFCFFSPNAVATLELLLERGANIEARNNLGMTPLLDAIETFSNAPIIELLLRKGADIEARDNMGWSPLLWAAEEEDEIIVEILLAKGADTEVRNQFGQTALSWACRRGFEDVVKLLLEHGVNIATRDDEGKTPLDWAREMGFDAISTLINTWQDKEI
ncbi:hypothetical protein PFICI_03634 [Pestalotiopsis fici W106-1]|uniref:Protein kinase domain-containing protein n=1 Tax=Pestalotiopsis fici (strain W106-1 / CGMCC3.15140) TaxID=1229662 RepID=W3XHX8_PESFW|nr:uncharacterized protein PFICI_03634 [Pestalotiopsis fici W106-1]ETS85609.1 hypothetical protein PFICI_03634 [Pestalotiopsis fici W106-1]